MDDERAGEAIEERSPDSDEELEDEEGEEGEDDDSKASAQHPPEDGKDADGNDGAKEGEAKRTVLIPRRKKWELHSRAKSNRTELDLDKETISKYFKMPLLEAATKIGIGATTLKRVCRRLGINRWPFARGPSQQKGKDRLGASSSQEGFSSGEVPSPSGARGWTATGAVPDMTVDSKLAGAVAAFSGPLQLPRGLDSLIASSSQPQPTVTAAGGSGFRLMDVGHPLPPTSYALAGVPDLGALASTLLQLRAAGGQGLGLGLSGGLGLGGAGQGGAAGAAGAGLSVMPSLQQTVMAHSFGSAPAAGLGPTAVTAAASAQPAPAPAPAPAQASPHKQDPSSAPSPFASFLASPLTGTGTVGGLHRALPDTSALSSSLLPLLAAARPAQAGQLWSLPGAVSGPALTLPVHAASQGGVPGHGPAGGWSMEAAAQALGLGGGGALAAGPGGRSSLHLNLGQPTQATVPAAGHVPVQSYQPAGERRGSDGSVGPAGLVGGRAGEAAGSLRAGSGSGSLSPQGRAQAGPRVTPGS